MRWKFQYSLYGVTLMIFQSKLVWNFCIGKESFQSKRLYSYVVVYQLFYVISVTNILLVQYLYYINCMNVVNKVMKAKIKWYQLERYQRKCEKNVTYHAQYGSVNTFLTLFILSILHLFFLPHYTQTYLKS